MVSRRVKRIIFVTVFLGMVIFVGVLVFAYMLSRDPGSDWEKPNVIEASQFRRKLKRYDNAVAAGQQGFVRFTQLEINSHIRQSLTNLVSDTNAPGMHLNRLVVNLSPTNLTVYSWGEYRVFNMPLKFVVQREFQLKQDGTNQWNMHMESIKVGEVEIPPRYWTRVAPILEPLDAPVRQSFSWTTNIPALLITRNELSQRPELRLYTYKPIPPEDLD